ncbi:MAG: flagellar protein FlgN [Fretibacterium sp.]|nr:flagellar protein FlgN [Fretibacterium sp.]
MRDDSFIKAKGYLLQEQSLYKALRTMVSRELEAIVLNCDMEELLALIEAKVPLIAQLESLAEAWQNLLSELDIRETYGTAVFWQKFLTLFPPDQADFLSQRLLENRAAAENLMEAEGKAESELRKHVDHLREKMRSMSRGRKAFITYTKMGGAQCDEL